MILVLLAGKYRRFLPGDNCSELLNVVGSLVDWTITVKSVLYARKYNNYFALCHIPRVVA